MKSRRFSHLAAAAGGSIGLLLCAALPRLGADLETTAPVPTRAQEEQGGSTESIVSDSSNDESRVPMRGERDEGRATENTRQGNQASAVWNLLREHLPVSQVLEYATLLVAIETTLFAIFLGAFGYFEWARYKKLKEDIESERGALDKRIESFRADLETQRTELAAERQTLHTRVEAFKEDLRTQEQRLIAYQRFLEAVLSQHSDLLVGLIGGFGSALQPEADRRLRSLIFEAEAVLDLFHPDRLKVVNALWHLEQIGADSAVSSLVQLRDDAAAESEIRVRAQIVLSRIQERLKEERKKPIVQLPGDGPRDRREDQAGLGDIPAMPPVSPG